MQPKNNILHFGQPKKQQRSKDSGNYSLTERKVSDSMTAEGPLGNLIKHTIQWTNNAIETLFDNVDTQLFEMAEISENATDQNVYFDAMRIVRLRRSIAHKELINHVQLGFEIAAISGEKTTKDVIDVALELDNLSLVEDDSLEEDLATQNMIAKAERDNRDNIKQLNQRMTYLYNGLTINSENNPLGPTSLCNSFALAVDALDADIKIKLLVFKLFDINFITKLDDLYSSANKLLIETGVLPDLKISYKNTAPRRSTHTDPGHTVPDHTDPGYTDPGGIPVNTPQQNQAGLMQNTQGSGLSQFIQQPMRAMSPTGDAEAFALIQQLIAQNRANQQHQQIPQSQYASTTDVMSSLSTIQTNPELFNNASGQQGGSVNSELLKEALKQSLQSNQQKQAINQSDDNIIDIISMLFDFILDDRNLVDSVKSLLSRLQIPIIKIALQDKSFFRNKNHPARKLLNELANAGLGVTDNVTAQDNPLYLKLENLVTRVTNEQTQDTDNSFFEELLDDLHRFLTQFNQGIKNKKGPSKDAALKLVTTELSSRISGKHLPRNIILLLERVWKDVMFDIFFSNGMESDEWDMAMTFVDTLIWSIDPKVDPQSQKQLVRVIPGILNALNAGLDRIHYPKELREQLLQDLQNCHLACMKGNDISDSELSQNGTAYISSNQLKQSRQQAQSHAESSADSSSSISAGLSPEELASIDAGVDLMLDGDLSNLDILDEDDLLASLEDGSEQAIADSGDADLIEDAYTQQARNLSAGAWVEFKGIDNQAYRAKISWMSEDSNAFIFVTQTGQIAEKSLQGLSTALRNKQASTLDESPVFERAMGAVLEELQEKTGPL